MHGQPELAVWFYPVQQWALYQIRKTAGCASPWKSLTHGDGENIPGIPGICQIDLLKIVAIQLQ